MHTFVYQFVFGTLGFQEILLIVIALMLLFGGKKIPELARGLGKGISEFKRGLNEPAKPEQKLPDGGKEEQAPETEKPQ